jgi:hypothetical protein
MVKDKAIIRVRRMGKTKADKTKAVRIRDTLRIRGKAGVAVATSGVADSAAHPESTQIKPPDVSPAG